MRRPRVTIRPHVREGSRTGSWMVDIPAAFTRSGKRERPLVPDEAAAIRLKMQVEGSSSVETTGRPIAITIGFLVPAWTHDEMLKVKATKKKLSSLETNLHQLQQVALYLQSLDLRHLTPRHLEDYQGRRRQSGVQPETINSELATFAQVQKWAVKERLLDKLVTVSAVPVARKRPDVLTHKEFCAVMDRLPSRLRPLIHFLAATGCRWGEAANLKWAHVDLEAGLADIVAGEEWSPKTAQSARTLFLSPSLVADLRTLPSGSQYVFPGRREDRPVTTAKRAFASAVKAAKIKRGDRAARITIKTLRKSFATWAAEQGMGERTLQELLGHVPGSRVTRKHYEQVRPERAIREIEAVWAHLSEGASA